MSDTTAGIQALSSRVRNILSRAGVTSDAEAACLTDRKFLAVYHSGRVALAEFRTVFPNPEPTLETLAAERDRIIAERDALRNYARALELKWWNEVDNRASGHPDTDRIIEDFRDEHDVADILPT